MKSVVKNNYNRKKVMNKFILLQKTFNFVKNIISGCAKDISILVPQTLNL